jgi:uncharacterized protein DUF3606
MLPLEPLAGWRPTGPSRSGSNIAVFTRLRLFQIQEPPRPGNRLHNRNSKGRRPFFPDSERSVLMPDDKTKADAADRARINRHEEYEVQDWSAKFGVSRERLLAAIDKVGPMAIDVMRELGK